MSKWKEKDSFLSVAGISEISIYLKDQSQHSEIQNLT